MTHKRFNISVSLFLILTPIVGVLGTILLLIKGHIPIATWIFGFVYLLLTGLAITGGYHRLFAHKSYQAAWPARLLFLLFGAAAFQGSVLDWGTDHRNHHRYTDTDKDPYSIKKGFWHAHIIWLFKLDASKRDYSNVSDLAEDRLVRFQHRYFTLLAVIMGFVLPCLIASCWGDALGGLIIVGALRISINHHLTFAINSVCHFIGKKTYSSKQSARDNWITAFFTYGEGYHNFHHQFPIDYRNGIRAYHFDPTKWLIAGLAAVGLAKDLRRVSQHRILRYQVQMAEQQLTHRFNAMQDSLKTQLAHLWEPVQENLHRALCKIEEFEAAYFRLRGQEEYRLQLKLYRRHIKTAQQEIKRYLLMSAHMLHLFEKECLVSVG